MKLPYKCAIAAAFVALPAVNSFCHSSPARPSASTSSSYKTFNNRIPTGRAVSKWTSSRNEQRQAGCLSVLEGDTLLKMQGPGSSEDGNGRQQVPGGDGYASNPEKVTPSWTPPTDFNDGFDEGVPRLNTVFLTGYLGQDPKPKYFDSGKVVLNLSLAVKREYHPIERKAFGIVYGEESTDWFQLEMWDRDAEYAAKVCKKGGRVGVTGAFAISAWTDREGNSRTTGKILVQNLELLDSRAEQASRSDRSDSNLWESERLEKADAVAERKTKAASGDGVKGRGGSGTYQSPEDLEVKARKKTAEDKWWSAEPDTVAAGSSTGEGVVGDAAGKTGEASWWDEDGGGEAGSKVIEPDSLPSFFDD